MMIYMQVPVGHGWMSGFIVEGVVARQTGWPRAVPSGPVAGVPWPGESNAQGRRELEPVNPPVCC
jgi:hypothetical protein